ncbi:MAG: Fe-S cluster assembly ATPase SufC, partial [Pseudomonadota bacterium]|nr:Fe-S cluster assembly ATPase SufC [Pseudomonadota bacterium]
MISIKNLHARIEEKEIIKGLSLEIEAGKVHAIMGPNGAGKSTLASVIAGREEYEVTDGEILMNGKDLLDLEPEERAAEGVFMAFQYPLEIPGVPMNTFMRTALNAQRKLRGEDELDSLAYLKKIKPLAKTLGVSDDMLKRALNEGCSGGEKKRNEVLQMAMLEPTFAVLDETDSGLDIDALRVVADGVNALRNEQRSFLVITHYQR